MPISKIDGPRERFRAPGQQHEREDEREVHRHRTDDEGPLGRAWPLEKQRRRPGACARNHHHKGRDDGQHEELGVDTHAAQRAHDERREPDVDDDLQHTSRACRASSHRSRRSSTPARNKSAIAARFAITRISCRRRTCRDAVDAHSTRGRAGGVGAQ